MTLDQALAFGLIAVTIGLFVWGRLPYDLVALSALLVGVLVGVVPEKHAFEGFSDEIIVIIAAALVVSACIARSGVIEAIMRPVLPKLRTTAVQAPVLAACVLLLSMVTKNVGALAIFMPIALQLARRHKTSPSSLLMPMAAASLTGGLVTLVGTSPNIIIAKVRADMFGHPFTMFDFTPVGLSIAALTIAFLAVGWRLLPERRAAASMDAAFTIDSYTAEAVLGPHSPAVGPHRGRARGPAGGRRRGGGHRARALPPLRPDPRLAPPGRRRPAAARRARGARAASSPSAPARPRQRRRRRARRATPPWSRASSPRTRR